MNNGNHLNDRAIISTHECNSTITSSGNFNGSDQGVRMLVCCQLLKTITLQQLRNIPNIIWVVTYWTCHIEFLKTRTQHKRWIHSKMTNWKIGSWLSFTLKGTICPYLAKPLQFHNLPVNCARELFKLSKDSASLLVAMKKILGFGFSFFCGWHHKWDRFKPFLSRLSGPGHKPQEGSISLKFLVRTRRKSESFKTLISFVMFLV